MVPVTDKVDVGLSFGPTIFIVSQEVPSAVTVTEPGPTITTTTLTSHDKTTVGVNFGIDVTLDGCTIYCGNYGIWSKGTGPLARPSFKIV